MILGNGSPQSAAGPTWPGPVHQVNLACALSNHTRHAIAHGTLTDTRVGRPGLGGRAEAPSARPRTPGGATSRAYRGL